MDLKKLLGDDPQAMAAELSRLGEGGRFDPMALFAGETRFHSVFLAPFSPFLADAVRQLIADGGGPLREVAKMFEKQGAPAGEAVAAAQAMFRAAQGMCVVVLVDDQSPTTVPQLFFGELEEPYYDQVARLCGEKFPDAKPLKEALARLRARAEQGALWPRLHAGGEGDSRAYWLDLAERLVAGFDQGIAPRAPERSRDLAHWIAAALDALGPAATADAEPAGLAARAHLIAGEVAPALAALDRAREGFDDADELAQLVHHAVDAAVALGDPAPVARWLGERIADIESRQGASYDLALALFKAEAAAQAPAERLLAACERLLRANRKAVRHDLSREPLWRVATADPGELLDTAQAAQLIERSPAFVAKRLEHGTIPTYRRDDQVRIPKAGLLAWKAVMDAHKLLD